MNLHPRTNDAIDDAQIIIVNCSHNTARGSDYTNLNLRRDFCLHYTDHQTTYRLNFLRLRHDTPPWHYVYITFRERKTVAKLACDKFAFPCVCVHSSFPYSFACAGNRTLWISILYLYTCRNSAERRSGSINASYGFEAVAGEFVRVMRELLSCGEKKNRVGMEQIFFAGGVIASDDCMINVCQLIGVVS